MESDKPRWFQKAGGKSMNEKAYKAMNFAGISGIVTGIIVAVVGVTAGAGTSVIEESVFSGKYYLCCILYLSFIF